MATLSELRDRVKRDITIAGTRYDAQIDDAARSVLTLLRASSYWFLETTTNLTLLSGEASVALPDNFASKVSASYAANGTRRRQNNGFNFVRGVEFEYEYQQYDTPQTGSPSAWTIIGTTMHVDKVANQDYTIALKYMRKDAVLPAQDGDTSIWFDEGFELVRAQTVVQFKRATAGFSVTDNDMAAVTLAEKSLTLQHGRIAL